MKNLTFDDTGIQGDSSAAATQLITQGITLVKAEAGYHTAIAVQKPRVLTRVQQAVLAEAEQATDDFYYQWQVKNRKTGKKAAITGGTISLALCIAREWGNNVVKIDVEEKDRAWCFKGSFIDLERGFTVERLFRKAIPRITQGDYDRERWIDMQFQKAQSQAVRNVIFSAVPRWLKEKAIEKARDAALRSIEVYGIGKAREAVVSAMRKLDVTEAQLEYFLEKSRPQWDKEDLALLKNIAVQIQNGDISADEAFPQATPAGKGTVRSDDQQTHSREPVHATQPAKDQAVPGNNPGRPAAVPGNGGNVFKSKDLFIKLNRLGLKDLVDNYCRYVCGKYSKASPHDMTDGELIEQEKILDLCKAKYSKLKEFKTLLGTYGPSEETAETQPGSSASQDTPSAVTPQ